MCMVVVDRETRKLRARKKAIRAYKILERSYFNGGIQTIFRKHPWTPGAAEVVDPVSYTQVRRCRTLYGGAFHFHRSRRRFFVGLGQVVVSVRINPRDIVGATRTQVAATRCYTNPKDFERALKGESQ